MSAGIAILAGCAGQRADVRATSAPGSLLIRPGRPGFVVAARATGDADSGAIATEIARHSGFGLVVARGSVPDEAGRQPSGAYERAVHEAAQGTLRFFVEIRGTDRTRCAGQMGIATSGVDPELALRLRALAELIRDAHLRANTEVERLAVLVEERDGASHRADGVARDGILPPPERALAIELPRCGRRDWREMYGAILADFVTQAAALPAGR